MVIIELKNIKKRKMRKEKVKIIKIEAREGFLELEVSYLGIKYKGLVIAEANVLRE
jgi:hypothetical protein